MLAPEQYPALIACVNSDSFFKRYGSYTVAEWKKAALSKQTFDGIELKDIAEFYLRLAGQKKKFPPLAVQPHQLLPAPQDVNAAQSSHHLCAQVKAHIARTYNSVIDLCGGYGVDAYYMAQQVNTLWHVEPNKQLQEVVKFNLKNFSDLKFYNGRAEDFLAQHSPDKNSLIYADPSRINAKQQRIKLLEDYEPNPVVLSKDVLAKNQDLLLKLSPMLDIKVLEQLWHPLLFDVHLICISNELKELLVYFWPNAAGYVFVYQDGDVDRVHELSLKDRFAQESKRMVDTPLRYVYDANAAFKKLNADAYLAERYDLYNFCGCLVSEEYHAHFPGKVFEFEATIPLAKEQKKLLHKGRFSVISKHPKLKAPDFEKRFSLIPHNNAFLIFLESRAKTVALKATRLY